MEIFKSAKTNFTNWEVAKEVYVLLNPERLSLYSFFLNSQVVTFGLGLVWGLVLGLGLGFKFGNI